jgi:hypothetical protein
MLIRANRGNPDHTFRDKLNAVIRFTGMLVRSIRRGAEPVPFPDVNLANVGGAIIPTLGRRWRSRIQNPRLGLNIPKFFLKYVGTNLLR